MLEGDATKTRHVIVAKAIQLIKQSLPIPEKLHLEGDIVSRSQCLGGNDSSLHAPRLLLTTIMIFINSSGHVNLNLPSPTMFEDGDSDIFDMKSRATPVTFL